MSKPIIEVINISKKFNIGQKSSDIRHSINNLFSFKHNKKPEIWALKDVSFEVHEGEVFGLIGPNGSGKSTLLKILSRITYPTSGKAILRGRVSSLLEVGTGFHNELTGRENIYLNGSILGMKRAEIKQKFDEIVDFSGIEQFIDTPVKHYSSGMYVRLAFSVAAHLEPEILLVDEVLSVGDLEFRQKSMGKMNEVAKKGRTVIFVSHNLEAIESLCTSGVLLDFGQMLIQDKIYNVINKYKNRFNLYEQIEIKNSTYPDIEIFKFDLIDSYNNKTRIISCGDSINVEISLNSKIDIENINLRIDIYDNSYQTKLVLSSYLTGDKFLIKKGTNCFLCTIHRIPLNVGLYKMDFGIARSGTYLFLFKEIIKLQITQGNYYPTGNTPESQYPYLLDHRWYSSNL